ncbi:hypothetical protein [Microbacterium sp.]|uniref:hypothetical protein n=1 Tax=Microbacterium sp. TaxID=51671 RepID=UPI003A8EE3D5
MSARERSRSAIMSARKLRLGGDMTARGRGRGADDIGHYLGFFGPAPWLLLALYTAFLLYSALILGGAARTGWGIAALVAALGALVVVALPSVTPLPMWRTVLILAVIVFVTAAVSWQLPADVADLGYQTWEYNPCDLLMFCLAIRARILWAWVGQAAMQATVAVWSISATGSAAHGLLTSYTQPFPLIACSVFAIGLHWTARQIVAHRAAERARVEDDVRADATDHALEVELAAVRTMAAPTLEHIAAGGRPDPQAVRALEAALRDRIRSPALAVEPLTSALRAARESGVDVLVLDDLGDAALTEAQRTAATTWAAERIAQADGRSLTLRVARAQTAPVVTMSVDGRGVSHLVL